MQEEMHDGFGKVAQASAVDYATRVPRAPHFNVEKKAEAGFELAKLLSYRARSCGPFFSTLKWGARGSRVT